MLTARELTPAIGQTVAYQPANGYNLATFYCVVVDARERFGRADVQIQPIAGKGQQWVAASSVTIVKRDMTRPGCPVEVSTNLLEPIAPVTVR